MTVQPDRRPARQPRRNSPPPRTLRSNPRTRAQQGLRPVRDTGIAVRRTRSRRRTPSPYPLLIAFSVITIVVMIFLIGRGGSTSDAVQSSVVAESGTVATATEPERDPTPSFAAYGDLKLSLPVDPSQITAVAFHQASGDIALHLTSLVPDADMDLAAELKAVPPLEGSVISDPDATDTVWQGCVLRLWRSNRTGAPDTAVDCGAEPGSPVWSPVTGTVVRVKAYKLYDKYDDYEIHIRPDGADDIDVVLIHVDGVKVSEGDHVKAGVTRIASVRLMSDRLNLQLGGYTPDGGDHVHMQLNAVVDDTLSGTDGS